MMHSRPEMNQEHPPGQIIPSSIPYGPGMGQIKYLRDMIKKYHEEEGYKALEAPQATLPSTPSKERSERLLGALLAYVELALWIHPTGLEIENSISGILKDHEA